jgi:hypothetical protein
MMQRQLCVALLVGMAAVAACEKKPGGDAAGALLASRAPAVGEFSDNPLLAFVPSDTPYALATFRAFPLDVVRKMAALAGPMWRKAFATAAPSLDDRTRQRLEEVLDAFDSLDVKGFEAQGFSAKARYVLYGLGKYPVARVELSRGDRVFDLVQRTAAKWELQLPPVTERAGRRYWLIDGPGLAALVALAPTELVLAVAPRDVLEANLATLLGEQRPANHMTTAQFRAIAERDGFTGAGVGFVDVVRVAGMITSAVGVAPACEAAIAAIAGRSPRLAFGYEELTTRRFGFGMVVELAPDLISELRGLSGKLVGLDRLIAAKPAFAMAVAANVDGGRKLLGRVGAALQQLGERCAVQEMIDAAAKLVEVGALPLPPAVAGLRGGVIVLNNFKIGARGPEALEGFGSLQLDQPGELLKLAGQQMPGIDTSLDGKPHALPAAIPFPGHLAANQRAIGFGLGSNSATTAVTALDGKPGPAPLVVLAFDYSRLGELMLASQPGPEAEAMRDMFKAFGLATFQLLVDARGLVSWWSFELR